MRRALAAALAFAAAAAQALTIESCVSSDALEVGAGDRHAFLDDGDRAEMAAAIAERFPLLLRDGFAPSRLLLWDRPGRGWVYVAVIENPRKRGEQCFTATVSAPTVPATRQVLRKYFPDRPA
jgi:hypothetical protein